MTKRNRSTEIQAHKFRKSLIIVELFPVSVSTSHKPHTMADRELTAWILELVLLLSFSWINTVSFIY